MSSCCVERARGAEERKITLRKRKDGHAQKSFGGGAQH